MHGRIYQVSETPIERQDWIDEDDAFVEGLMDYTNADVDREDDIQDLVRVAGGGVFQREGDALVLINIKPLLERWRRDVDRAIEAVRAKDITDWWARWRLKFEMEKPLGDRLFWISGYSDCVRKGDSFVEWLATLKPGQKIYIGATLDYHY